MYLNYAGMTFDEAEKQEKVRLARAQQQIDAAKSYKKREEAAAKEQQRLMDEAGTASGKAQVIRDSLGADRNAPRFSIKPRQKPSSKHHLAPLAGTSTKWRRLTIYYAAAVHFPRAQENMLQEILKAATGHNFAQKKCWTHLKKSTRTMPRAMQLSTVSPAKVQRNTNAVDLH